MLQYVVANPSADRPGSSSRNVFIARETIMETRSEKAGGSRKGTADRLVIVNRNNKIVGVGEEPG